MSASRFAVVALLAVASCVGTDPDVNSGGTNGTSDPKGSSVASGIRCGSTTCAAGEQICCAGGAYDQPPTSWTCATNAPASCTPPNGVGDAGLYEVRLACVSPSDCAGQGASTGCCVEHETGGRVVGTRCSAPEACTGEQTRLACDPKSPSCPAGTSCQTGPYNFADYFECR